MEGKDRGCMEDEISLVDIFLVLARRKSIVLAVFLIVFAASIIYALTQRTSESFAYTTAIEVGSVIVGETMTDIDSIGNLTAKIEQAYIPAIESELGEKVNVSVDSPRNSNLIVFKSIGSEGQLQRYSEQHKRLFNLLLENLSTRLRELGADRVIKTRIIGETREEVIQKKSRNSVFVGTLGAVLGLMLGVFAAFFVEFVANMRRELRDRQRATES